MSKEHANYERTEIPYIKRQIGIKPAQKCIDGFLEYPK
jgi:hypothetical protein